MTTPNLIVQPRELARSIGELHRQKEQSLDAIAAARDREIAAAEQARLDANRSYDTRLAEFLELEQGARAVLKYMGAKASGGGDAAPPLMPIPDPVKTLSECKSEIEHIYAGLTGKGVRWKIVDVPSDVDQARVKRILQVRDETPVKAGDTYATSLRWVCKVIPQLKELGIKAELEV